MARIKGNTTLSAFSGKRPVGSTGQAAVLDPSQIRRLLKIAQTGNHSQRDQKVIVLSYWLGLRAKELASLRTSDVYLPDGSVKQILHLKSAYTKRAKTRDVYLSSDVVQRQLKEYWGEFAFKFDPSRPLFMTRTGKAFTPNGMVHLLRHLHVLAGIEGGSSHSGRRTMITRLAEAGVDLKSIATLAGHSSIRTTAVYVDNYPFRLFWEKTCRVNGTGGLIGSTARLISMVSRRLRPPFSQKPE